MYYKDILLLNSQNREESSTLPLKNIHPGI